MREIRNFLKKSGYTSFEDIIQFVSGMNGELSVINIISGFTHLNYLIGFSNIVNDDDDKSYKNISHIFQVI